MSVVWRTTFFFCVLFIFNSILAIPVPEKENEKAKDESPDSDTEESSAEEKGTVSPEVMKKLEEEIIENEEKTAEKYGEIKPEEVHSFLEEEEKIYGTNLPKVVEKELAETKTHNELQNFAKSLELFNRVKITATKPKEVTVNKTPEEMKKLKEETYRLMNELNQRTGLAEMSPETFDEIWDENKKEFGKHFHEKAEVTAIALKKTIDQMDEAEATETTPEVSEPDTVTTTQSADIMKEELPQGTFALRNAKGEICILAKFQSSITITYPGKSSELKVEVTIPHSGHTKGKCRGPHGSALLQIAWGKFVFSLSFNKTTEDTWGATLVELTYDTSEPLFDGAAEREKITAKSKKVSLFETPYEKSYFCAAQEVILLYRDDQQVATVRLKEIHLQPYDVEDGKFSPSHHCNQVVIGDPDEEPFVQDETVPLAVGCTLALITLLILVGFSVHRAYNAAKVDYNTME